MLSFLIECSHLFAITTVLTGLEGLSVSWSLIVIKCKLYDKWLGVLSFSTYTPRNSWALWFSWWNSISNSCRSISVIKKAGIYSVRKLLNNMELQTLQFSFLWIWHDDLEVKKGDRCFCCANLNCFSIGLCARLSAGLVSFWRKAWNLALGSQRKKCLSCVALSWVGNELKRFV